MNLQQSILGVSRIHFFYVLAFAASIIVYDASHLIEPEAVLYRWKLAVAMAVITTVVWYIARTKNSGLSLLKWSVTLLVIADILFAALLVYADRGMASVAVALYAVPIATSAALLSRSAILATASLCTASYALASVKYFVDFFNEGYKVQLYSTIGFYGATFFIIALLITTVIHRTNKK